MKNKIVDDYLSDFISKSTKHTYRCAINSFFKYLKENPDTYFNENRNYASDVEKYFVKKDYLELLIKR